ncbi:MAG: 6-phosphogluconolactonase [bacterium]|nr:6-phosphogluconolactonase [bacterium]
MTQATVHRFDDAAGVAQAAAERLRDAAREAVAERGRFVFVLAGGRTPVPLYDLLTRPPFRDEIPWDQTIFLFGDERCVPPDHAESNYKRALDALLAPLGVTDKQVFRIECELKPLEAAARYQLQVRELFTTELLPRFDCVLLGIGADGHTASLFPGTDALDEPRRWVAPNHVPQLDAWRVTLTTTALAGARRVIFLATGRDKARAVAEAFGGVDHPTPLPAERIRPEDGRVEVLVDAEAGSALP